MNDYDDQLVCFDCFNVLVNGELPEDNGQWDAETALEKLNSDVTPADYESQGFSFTSCWACETTLPGDRYLVAVW